MYTFFAKHLLGVDHGPVKERRFDVERAEDVLVWYGRTLPANALDAAGVYRVWKETTRVATPSVETLRYALSVENPTTVRDARSGERVLLSRPNRNDRVTGFYQAGQGEPVLIIAPNGAAKPPAQGRPVLAIDVWNTGAAKGTRDTSVSHFLTFHRTDTQNKVQDILTALAWLKAKHPGKIELRATGDAAIWATLAAAVADAPLALKADPVSLTGSEDEMLARYFIPGLARVGGWKAATSLVESRK